MTSKDFFKKQREWSTRKHHILTEYLKCFCTSLSRRAQRNGDGYIYYVDCFAGEGTYELEDGSTNPGSPILAAEIASSLPYQIKCINVESHSKRYANLVNNTRAYGERIINLYGAISEHLETILRLTRNSPALFFIDPFGVKDIAGLVEAVACRYQPTDVLIRYDPTAVRRLCGAALKNSPECAQDTLPGMEAYLNRASRSFQDGTKYAAHLDKLFAGPHWREIRANATDWQELDTRLRDLYLRQLTKINGGKFKVAASYHVRTIEDESKYYLLFATGDKLGAKMMSDVLYSTEKHFIEQKEALRLSQITLAQTQQFSLFTELAQPTEEELFTLKINQIATAIIGATRKQASWTYDNLYYELLLNKGGFGRMTDKLFRYVCKQLAEEGLLRKGPGAWGKDTILTITI